MSDTKNDAKAPSEAQEQQNPNTHDKPKEVGGPKGLEPTRYGDWEAKGRCVDF